MKLMPRFIAGTGDAVKDFYLRLTLPIDTVLPTIHECLR